MTIALLNQLHDHKLTQVRTRAQKQIESWSEAIAVVKKAEQESKCIIALPEQLTNIAAVEKRVGSVGYMDVLDVEDEITISCKQVYEVAIEKLKVMATHYQKDEAINTQISQEKSKGKRFKLLKWDYSFKTLFVKIAKFSCLATVAFLIFCYFQLAPLSVGDFFLMILLMGSMVFFTSFALLFFLAMLVNQAAFSTGDIKNAASQELQNRLSRINGAITHLESYRTTS